MKLLKRLYILFVIGIILFFILTILTWSLSSRWPWPELLPNHLDLRGIKFAFGSTNSLKILCSSIMISSIVTIITLIICFPAARAMAFYEFKGKKIINVLILLPLIVPMITVVLGIHINFIKWGLANKLIGVILIHILPGIPYGVRILENSFRQVGKSVELQGQVLGATWWQTLRYITMPLLLPSIVVSGTMIYILSFSQYFITFLIGGGKVMTYSLLIFPFIESGDRTLASALSIVFILSIFLVMMLSNRLLAVYMKKNIKVLSGEGSLHGKNSIRRVT